MTDSSFGLHGSPRPPRRRGWVLALGLVALILIGNAVVFYFYKQKQLDPLLASRVVRDGVEAPGAAIEDDGHLHVCPKCGKVLSANGHESEAHTEAEEERAKGIELLREGKYAEALTALQDAKARHGDLENIDALIEVARKLRRGGRRTAPPPPTGVAPARPSPQRVARRIERRRRQSPPPKRRRAMILVTTKPDSLVVHVDGEVRDMSPARIQVEPGRHRVEIFRDGESLLDETVQVAAGDTKLINRTFDLTPEEPSPPALPTERELSSDRSLDLVELLERDDVGEVDGSPTEASARADTLEEAVDRIAPPPASSSPRVVFYPSGRNAARARSLLAEGLSGARVELVSGEAELRRQLAAGGADAVVAPPAVLRGMGLSPSLVAEDGGAYVLASFSQDMTASRAAAGTLAVIDEFGRKGTPAFVARLHGLSEPPPVRRVNKVEDLLTFLQLGQADAILVRPRHLETLRARTQRELHSTSLQARSVALAVAFVDGGRRSSIESKIRNLSGEAKAALGISRWATR